MATSEEGKSKQLEIYDHITSHFESDSRSTFQLYGENEPFLCEISKTYM
jgi:hypothetical protein